jgi:AcrR family transcriptional regulator
VREKLLAAADACYAEKGPVRTRMSDIARRAGVHRSTVYYYFAQKDTLLAASRPRAAAGEIRRDLSADTLARWIVRINFSVIAEPARPEDGGGEGLLRNLLIASLDPCAQRDRPAGTTDD